MKTSIIILTKDKPELISHCLMSILPEIGENEVLVGDTGSTHPDIPGIYENARKVYGDRLQILNLKYYHFSKNNNEVARSAKGDLFIFLNNDTVGHLGWIREVIRGFESRPGVGVVGPKLLFGNDERVQHAGVEFIRAGTLQYLAYHPYRGRHALMPEVNRPKLMPAVTGACLAIRKDLFWQIGGFDEEYTKEAQDVDICLKAWQAGQSCIYWPKAVLYHLENGTRTLCEEDSKDRSLLRHRWRNFVDEKFLGKMLQSEDLSLQKPQRYIMFKRLRARGDVVASVSLVRKYKALNPHDHITFLTEFPDLVDSFPEIDRVLVPGEIDEYKYDRFFDLSYESGEWKTYPGSWLGEMNRRILPQSEEFDYPVPGFSPLEKAKAQYFENESAKKPYVVVSTGAGWQEREWTPRGWEELTLLLQSRELDVYQIGGSTDYQVSGARKFLNRSLQENYAILKNARLFVTLDSFPLHIGIMAGVRTALLTCKTCSNTIYLPKTVIEIRNRFADRTPKPGCRSIGCRLKEGNGLDNSCASPILKELKGEEVHAVIFNEMGFKI